MSTTSQQDTAATSATIDKNQSAASNDASDKEDEAEAKGTFEFELEDPIYIKVKNFNTLFAGDTQFQNVAILQHERLGKFLMLDGVEQSNYVDDSTYHETLVHPAMIASPVPPKRVLIAGGGEFATAREVLKHTSVVQCDMVDIDGQLVELCKVHMAEMHQNCYLDSRLNVVIGDAKAFIEQAADNLYDVIIMDLSDPNEGGPCYQLYTREMYECCKRKLTPQGVLVTQAESADKLFAHRSFAKIYSTLRHVFNGENYIQAMTAHLYLMFYNLGFIMVFNNSDDDNKKQEQVPHPCKLLTAAQVQLRIEERIKGGQAALNYYSGECHVHTTHLPLFLRRLLNETTHVYTSDNFTGTEKTFQVNHMK